MGLSIIFLISYTRALTGEICALCTALQDELEQEAEIMGLNKPLKLPRAAQKKFGKSAQYGRVTAPFTVARKALFHEVPYLCIYVYIYACIYLFIYIHICIYINK
jgi:hypothetical protein